MSNELVPVNLPNLNPDPNAKHDLVYQVNYPSLTDLLHHVEHGDYEIPDANRQSLTKGSGYYENWYGTADMETTLHLARFGWEDGLKMIKELVKKVQVKFPTLFPKPDAGAELIHSVVGAYEDPSMEDSNNPENMITFKPHFDEQRMGSMLQRIIIETATSAYITAETYFLRGAALIALIDQLETYGFRLEVVLQDTTINHLYGNTQRGKVTAIRTVIKKFEDSVDMDSLAFCIANQSFARRLMFAELELVPQHIRQLYGVPSNYGVPCNYPIYMDPKKDFYMTRPMGNESLEQVITTTVDLINKRYAGIIDGSENEDLSQMNNAAAWTRPSTPVTDNDITDE